MFKKSPALFLLLFIVSGILIADFFRFDISIFFLSLIFSVVSALFCIKSQKQILLYVFIGLSMFSFSGLRFASLYYESGVNHISNFIDNKSTYTIYGKVSDWPELKLKRTEITIDVDSLEGQHINTVHGKILLKINMVTTQFQKGDYIVFKGRIYSVEGESFSEEFNYSRFLRYKEINGVSFQTTPLYILHDKANRFSIIPIVDKLRTAIINSFERNLSQVSAALASGFLIGETRDIPPELYTRFKDSGTLHLLAVSGSNVILVITFFSFLLSPFSFSRKKRSFVLLIIVLLFSLLSYGEPSVVRASIMAGLVLFAGVAEKRYELKNIIAVAAFLILLFKPSQLFDLGFQLSFVIAWGLILAVPVFHQLYHKYHLKKWYNFLLLPFIVSLTAQLFSIGLIGLYFKQIPLLSPLANLFIVPLVSTAVIGILILLVADLILPLLGLFVGSILNQILEFTVYVVELFGADSMPLITVHDWTILGVSGLYLILFLIPFSIFSKPKRRMTAYFVLVFINLILISKAVTVFTNSDSIDIICMNIPGGNMAIVNPAGKEIDLVINGIKGKKYNIDEKIISPNIKKENIKKLDKLIVLHSDFSAIDDILRIAEKFSINSLYIPKDLENSFVDQITNLKKESLISRVNILYPLNSLSPDSGYMLNNEGFSLVYKNYKLTFVEKVSEKNLQNIPNHKKQYLIIGSTWNISLNDYLLLNELNYQSFICSKIAQIETDENFDLTEKSTNLIVNLYKRSQYRIKLTF